MKQLINKHLFLIFVVIPAVWVNILGCAGSSGKSINIGPVPHANGIPGNGDSTRSDDPARDPKNLPDPYTPDKEPIAPLAEPGTKPADTSSVVVTPVVVEPPLPAAPSLPAVVTPAPATTPAPASVGAPTKCTGYYALGYGAPYQSNDTGPWLAKNKADFTEPCAINAPACTSNGDLGFGTKWAHGKLWLAKLTDAKKGMEDVCIITKLTGTNG